ncbi:uncharacterized protein [Amphiura filiformis]|uniref:uncharacterized protein n=1 Tax=Amphiura filiformis TaxID=82378 RepID=UPI003B212744
MASMSTCFGCILVIMTFAEIAAQSFDCTTLHPNAFSSRDGRKCYYPDVTVGNREWSTAASFCQNHQMGGFGDWILMNPRNFDEYSRIREALGAFELGAGIYWWFGQREADEGIFRNVDDPSECPGVFLQWQKDSPTNSQPNGNIGDQEDQDCIILVEKDQGIAGANGEPFQDKACYWSAGYQTFCKHITSGATVDCSTLHADAFQRTEDPTSCYLSEDDATGATHARRTFYSAVEFCEDLTAGGVDWHIPDILSKEEAEFLRDDANGLDFETANGGDGFWIGQNDMTQEEVYQYYNQPEGCPPVFLHWLYPDQPNGPLLDTDASQQDCIAIKPDVDDGAEDKPCDEMYYTACEMTIPCLMFEKDQYTIGEQNGTLTVRLLLQDHKEDTVTVDVTVQDVTTSNFDYIWTSPTSLTINANEAYKDIEIPIQANDGPENLESFTLTLQNPTAIHLCQPYTTTVFISDETTSFRLEVNEVVVYEDSIVNATVHRDGYRGNTDTIKCTITDGTATLNEDYTSLSEMTLTFLPGEDRVEKAFVTLADEVEDDMETFSVSIEIDPLSTTASTALLRNPNEVEIFIIERPVSEYEFQTNQISAQEDNTAVEFIIKRTGDTSQAGYVHVSTKPVTASPELDYETIDNILIGFNPLETEKSLVLDIVPDTEPESPETVMICLSDPGQGEAIGPLNFVVVTIYDDDVGYCFDGDTHVVSENNGSLSLRIKKNGPTDTATTISVQPVDQTAFIGSDYAISPTDVLFRMGVDTIQVDIDIINDGKMEPLETFHLQLISGGNVVCTAVVWIRDAVGYCFDGDTHVVSENDGSLSLRIKKHGPTDTATTISVQPVDQTAFIGSDYAISPTDVLFRRGVDTIQVDIDIINDGKMEPLETFHLQLISGGNVVCTAVVWIRDADRPCNLECLNGGICSGPPETCVCQPGFIGDRCEIDPCPDNYCQNGGTCFVEDDGNLGTCFCEDGYTGANCETAEPREPLAIESEGLSTGGIFGIILGALGIIVMIGIAVLVFTWLRLRLRPQKTEPVVLNAIDEPNQAPSFGYPNSQNWSLVPGPYTSMYRSGGTLY